MRHCGDWWQKSNMVGFVEAGVLLEEGGGAGVLLGFFDHSSTIYGVETSC